MAFPSPLTIDDDPVARRRGFVQWLVRVHWDFGNPLATAANMTPGPTIPGTVAALKEASGSAFVRVLVPFTVQHGAWDKPLSAADRQRTAAEGTGAPGGPTRADRSKVSVSWGAPRTTEQRSDGKGASLIGAPVVTDANDDGGTVSISPQIQMQTQLAGASQEQRGFSFIAGESFASQYQAQMGDTQMVTRTFTADVRVPPPTDPRTQQREEVASAHVGPFNVDSDRLASNWEERISRWYADGQIFEGPDPDPRTHQAHPPTSQVAPVSQGARDLVESGQVELRVTGHASATGSFAHNRDLSRRRAEKISTILKDLAGSDVKINLRALGKVRAHPLPGQPREDPAERRVHIQYSATVSTDPAAVASRNRSDSED